MAAGVTSRNWHDGGDNGEQALTSIASLQSNINQLGDASMREYQISECITEIRLSRVAAPVRASIAHRVRTSRECLELLMGEAARCLRVLSAASPVFLELAREP